MNSSYDTAYPPLQPTPGSPKAGPLAPRPEDAHSLAPANKNVITFKEHLKRKSVSAEEAARKKARDKSPSASEDGDPAQGAMDTTPDQNGGNDTAGAQGGSLEATTAGAKTNDLPNLGQPNDNDVNMDAPAATMGAPPASAMAAPQRAATTTQAGAINSTGTSGAARAAAPHQAQSTNGQGAAYPGGSSSSGSAPITGGMNGAHPSGGAGSAAGAPGIGTAGGPAGGFGGTAGNGATGGAGGAGGPVGNGGAGGAGGPAGLGPAGGGAAPPAQQIIHPLVELTPEPPNGWPDNHGWRANTVKRGRSEANITFAENHPDPYKFWAYAMPLTVAQHVSDVENMKRFFLTVYGVQVRVWPVELCTPLEQYQRRRYPYTLLVTGAPKAMYDDLMSRKYISADAGTVGVLPFCPPPDDFAFMFTGSVYEAGEEPLAADSVKAQLRANKKLKELLSLYHDALPADTTNDNVMDRLLSSMRIEFESFTDAHSDTKKVLHVYITPPTTNMLGYTEILKAYMATSLSNSNYAPGGKAERFEDNHCSYCHSVSHMLRNCPFPRIPGWKGRQTQWEEPERVPEQVSANVDARARDDDDTANGGSYPRGNWRGGPFRGNNWRGGQGGWNTRGRGGHIGGGFGSDYGGGSRGGYRGGFGGGRGSPGNGFGRNGGGGYGRGYGPSSSLSYSR
ncbi:hypothetical protein FB107DRAFT_268965 [Schizophyllum commune]